MAKMDIETSVAYLYDGGWRVRDREKMCKEFDLTEDEADLLCAALAKLEKAHKTFDTLRPSLQWSLVREFCSDQALDYLFPEDSLEDLLESWGLRLEDAYYLGALNGPIEGTDEVFMGDADNSTIESFPDWEEYKKDKFYPEVLDEFEEWMGTYHPELEMTF